MIHNLTSGGGGTSLNFKVVGGTTQPTSPKENTIWVKTSTAITGWEFSPTEPATPAEGMVWISTGTSSEVEFNALKKNGIQVCPLAAKQYVGGQWVPVEAFTYKSGKWVDWWDGSSLYKDGNEYPTATGGWAARGWRLRDAYTAQVPTLNKQADKMVATQTGKGTYVSGVVEILSDIDLTPYTTLSIEYMGTGVNGTHYFVLGVAERGAAYYSTNALALAQPTYKAGESAKVTANLDIAEVNQAADVFLGLHLTSSMNGTATLNIYRVWLE